MTSPVIKHLVDEYKNRFLVITLLCFVGFLRIDELSPSKSKNDQLQQGHIVYISRLDSKYCPFQHTEEFD